MNTEEKKIIIQVVTPLFKSHITCITPVFANFLRYMDGELDYHFWTHVQKKDGNCLKDYFHNQYGSNTVLKALLFYVNLPGENIRTCIRETFPNVKMLIFTGDIHKNRFYEAIPRNLCEVDGIIGLTTHSVFKSLSLQFINPA